jgi:hypothetical protein
MNDTNRATLTAHVFAAEMSNWPVDTQRAYYYLFARIAADTGAFALVNDVLPEGGMHLVLRTGIGGSLIVAERPVQWTREEEERYVAEMRAKLLGPSSMALIRSG